MKVLESTPGSRRPEPRIIRQLRQEQRVAHWKFKVICQRDNPVARQKWLEKKQRIQAELQRQRRHYHDKDKDTKHVEQILASTNDSWRILKRLRLAQRRSDAPSANVTRQ